MGPINHKDLNNRSIISTTISDYYLLMHNSYFNPTRIGRRRIENWRFMVSLSAGVACLLRRSNNGYEGRMGHYGEVSSLCLFY